METVIKLLESLELEGEEREEVEHNPISQSADESEEESEEIYRTVQDLREENERLEKRNKELDNELKYLKEIFGFLDEYEDSEQGDDENGLDQVQEKQQGTAAEDPDLDSTA